MNINIVSMAAGHLPDVMMIEGESFSTPWSWESFRTELGNPDSRAFVALVDSTVAGYICIRRIWDEGHILNLAVHPNFRRRGIARSLVLRAIEEFRAGRCKDVFLEVRVSNRAAIGLYEALGFKRERLRRSYYVLPLEDALVMSLPLFPVRQGAAK